MCSCACIYRHLYIHLTKIKHKHMIIDKIGEGHYQTRDRRPVVIEGIKGITEYPVRGYVIKKDGSKGTRTWTKEGVWSLTNTPHDLDLIPVAQPEPKQKNPVKVGIPTAHFIFPESDYTKIENEDGTITLIPIDKEYQANYEKALQFLDKTPENVMWPHSDLAKILVEFLNSVK